MVRVARDRTGAMSQVLTYVTERFQEIQNHILDEQDSSGRIDVNYQAGLDAEIKAEGALAIKMLRWLIEVNLNLAAPAAFNDAQVDAINPDIRTFEDGN